MGRVLSIIGAGFLGLIGLGAVGGGTVYVKSRALNSEGRAYVETTFPMAGAAWTKDSLLSHATPEFRESVKGDNIDRLVAELNRLGPFKGHGAPADAGIFVHYGPQGKIVIANYRVTVTGANGDAQLLIGLLKRDEKWLINGVQLKTDPKVIRTHGA